MEIWKQIAQQLERIATSSNLSFKADGAAAAPGNECHRFQAASNNRLTIQVVTKRQYMGCRDRGFGGDRPP